MAALQTSFEHRRIPRTLPPMDGSGGAGGYRGSFAVMTLRSGRTDRRVQLAVTVAAAAGRRGAEGAGAMAQQQPAPRHGGASSTGAPSQRRRASSRRNAPGRFTAGAAAQPPPSPGIQHAAQGGGVAGRNMINVASERKASREEVCEVFIRCGRRKANGQIRRPIKTAKCGIPPEIAEQLRNGHKNTDKMHQQVCGWQRKCGARAGGTEPERRSRLFGGDA